MDIDTPVTETFGDQIHTKRQRTNSFGTNSISAAKIKATLDIPKWQAVSENAFNGIVSIRFYMPMSFDGESSLCSEATGFIVDAERGIILTNRHVVGSGPFVGEAIMHDHEEVSVKAIYRDPIHDFGFLQFDPSQ
ncbi:hypothetical protein J3B02_005274, partial [Coemansia erecta]